MKSTLPALFRIHSKQKQSKITLSPEKQIPYYNLNLTISHSYRTKIINPQHKQSSAEDKLPNNSVLKFKQRYSQYPSRSLSVTQSYTSDELQTIDHPSARSRPPFTLQQIDNVRVNIRKVNQQLHLLTVAVRDVPPTHEQLKKQLQGMGDRVNQGIDSLQKQMKERVAKLSDLLSRLRRQTNIQLKSLKREADFVKQEIEEGKSLIKDIDDQRVVLKSVNF